MSVEYNKHLTNGPKGNSEVEGKETHCFQRDQSLKSFVIPSNSRPEKKCKEIVLFTPAGSQICCGFKEHHLGVESSCCFPEELTSFVHQVGSL